MSYISNKKRIMKRKCIKMII